MARVNLANCLMTWSFTFSGFDTDLAGRSVRLLGWISAGILYSRMASWEPLGMSTAPAPTYERGKWCCQTCSNPNFTQDSIYSSHTPDCASFTQSCAALGAAMEMDHAGYSALARLSHSPELTWE